jgi:dihydrofolate synthase/folylpolyglutamate synthase
VAECLRIAGLHTGLFVSPHISCFRERIQVQGQLISETDVLRLLPQVLQLCVTHQISATLFEITFILACMYYRYVGIGAWAGAGMLGQ